MLKRIVLVTALALTGALALVSTAAADGGSGMNDGSRKMVRSGASCVIAGVKFLTDNNLLAKAAQQQVDYDTIDSDSGGSEGLINTDLPSPSFLPLADVIGLHWTNPELFDWCMGGDDEDRISYRRAMCVHAGVRFLVDNNLLVAAALQQVDYDTIDSDSGKKEGLINTDLPSPSFLPLGAVIDLHVDSPRLFDWCIAAAEADDDDDDDDDRHAGDDDDDDDDNGRDHDDRDDDDRDDD